MVCPDGTEPSEISSDDVPGSLEDFEIMGSDNPEDFIEGMHWVHYHITGEVLKGKGVMYNVDNSQLHLFAS